MSIEDRTTEGTGDCFLVTGSIGPHFEPKLFKNKVRAENYAEEIVKWGRDNKVLPIFKPCIECRWRDDMMRMGIEE